MRVVIVGAGFGGIAAAIELRGHGFDRVTLLEAADAPGGTWLHNDYPGAACDVPSHAYSFSYAQRADWPRLCSHQPEILRYANAVIDRFGLRERIVTGSRVIACEWSDAEAVWTVRSEEAGEEVERRAEAIVIATGQLNQPAIPAIEGREEFAGHSFHSARWDWSHDLSGERVAVIGNGASAVQFVPEIAPQVAHLDVFQRSGNWFLPRRNRAYPGALRRLFSRLPPLVRLRRRGLFAYLETLTALIRHPRTLGRVGGLVSAAFMRRQLPDPELRARAWPDYTFGCKRVLFSSHFLPALGRANVDLVTDPIARFAADGIVTADGRLHRADCVIWATGFRTNDFMFPMRITGRDGLELAEAWSGGAHAHLGMTVPGFPSMFVLYGPNTNTSGGSIIFYLEAQARYLRQALERVRDSGAAAIEVRPEVESASDRRVQERFAGTAWTRCDSWYRDESGRIVANWPGYMWEYDRLTRELDPSEYRLLGTRPAATSQPKAPSAA